MHERGLADDKLVEDHERDRFAGVDRRPGRPTTGGRGRRATDDADARTDAGDERPAARAGRRPRDDANTEYEQGREDEAAERESRR